MNIVIVSGAVIIENNNVLVIKHGDDHFWKFPGGRLEDSDEFNLEKTARREAKEEIGVELKIIRPMKTMLSKKGDLTVVLAHWLAKRIGEVTPGSDVKAWQWLDIRRLPDDISPNIRPIIEEYLAEQHA